MIGVVGCDADLLGEFAGQFAATERDDEIFDLSGLDGTVRPTVESGPSPTLRSDLQILRPIVLDLELKAEVLIAAPDRLP